jgi:hypothetical protein
LSILDIRVQKLFAITLALKVISSALGWYFQSPWIFGLAVPLAIMAGYIWVGFHRRDTDVSDEKFADSAYYLGFIFTITSIIFSLFDLPYIGTRIQDIAVRFGAAMISTVFGLFVRVYLVSFRADVGDAMRNAEDALLGATQVFTDRLTMALERLQDFESRVDLAASSSVERVNMQVESLSKNHAEKLTAFFADLTTRNQEAFTTALEEVKNASVRLASSVDRYSTGMKGNLASIEEKVTVFATAVTTRLQNTSFPDDYFARQLQSPMAQLESAAAGIAQQVNAASQQISKTTKVLGTSLQKVQNKSGEAEQSMDSILRLAGQQHLILETAQGQLGTLEKVAEHLTAFDKLLGQTMGALAANNRTTEALTAQVENLAAESVEGRQAIERSLTGNTAELAAYRTAAAQLVEAMVSTNSSSERVAARIEDAAASQVAVANHLRESAAMSVKVTSKYDQTMAEAREASSGLLAAIDQRADKSLAKIGEAVQALQDIVSHVSDLSKSLRSQGDAAGFATGRLSVPRGGSMFPSSTDSLLPSATLPMAHSPSSAMPPGDGAAVASQQTFQPLQPTSEVPSDNAGARVFPGAALDIDPTVSGVGERLRYPLAGSEQTPPTESKESA